MKSRVGMRLFFIFFLMLASLYGNAIELRGEFYIDNTKALSLKQITHLTQWQEVTQPKRFGYINSVVWLRYDLSMLPRDGSYVAKYGDAQVEHITFYLSSDEGVQKSVQGILEIHDEKSSLGQLFVMQVERAKHPVLYVKIEHFGSIENTITVSNDVDYLLKVHHKSMLDGVLYGVLLVMGLYHLLLFFATRYSYYITYVMLVLSNFLFQATAKGLIFTKAEQWYSAFNPVSNLFFALLFVFFAMRFVMQLLDITTQKNRPICYTFRTLIALAVLSIGTVIMAQLMGVHETWLFQLHEIALLPLVAIFVTILGVSIGFYVKGNETAKYVTWAWSALVLTVIYYVAQLLGLVPTYQYMDIVIDVAIMLEVILLALILIEKIYRLNENHDKLVSKNELLEEMVEERTQALQKQLYRDQITGINNRVSLFKALKNANAKALCLINIDRFKSFNELYGVDVGNEILQQFADFLQRSAHNHDATCFRIGSDEFVVLIEPELHMSNEALYNTASSIARACEKQSFYVESVDESMDLTVTIGCAKYATDLVNRAGRALEIARRQHQKVMIYNEEMDDTSLIITNMFWSKEIKKALRYERFVPVFQPIETAHSIKKFELLMRLKLESGEVISPLKFLDVAVKSNQYVLISRYILQKGIQAIAQSSCELSINISYFDIISSGFTQWLEALLKRYELFHRIIIEITENAQLENYFVVYEFCEYFRDKGVRIAVDDFGSGYSNFTHILALQPDYIKIDGSIVKQVDIDESSRTLVKSIITIADELNITTIAEYVHSEMVYNILQTLGVAEFQGYYISQPLSSDEAKQMCTTLIDCKVK